MLVHEATLFEAPIEACGDPRRPIRVTGEEHNWSVVAALRVKVDLGHVRAPRATWVRHGRQTPFRVAYAS